MQTVFYLGYTLGTLKPVAAAAVPSNYKDPAVIAKKQAELAQEAIAISASIPTAGTLTSFTLMDSLGKVVAEATQMCDPAPHSTARVLVKALSDAWTKSGGQLTVSGFSVHAAVRVACIETIASNTPANEIVVPVELYRGDSIFIKSESVLFDPYTLLLNTDARRYVTLPALLDYFGIPYVERELLFPQNQADLARAVSDKARLFRAA